MMIKIQWKVFLIAFAALLVTAIAAGYLGVTAPVINSMLLVCAGATFACSVVVVLLYLIAKMYIAKANHHIEELCRKHKVEFAGVWDDGTLAKIWLVNDAIPSGIHFNITPISDGINTWFRLESTGKHKLQYQFYSLDSFEEWLEYNS